MCTYIHIIVTGDNIALSAFVYKQLQPLRSPMNPVSCSCTDVLQFRINNSIHTKVDRRMGKIRRSRSIVAYDCIVTRSWDASTTHPVLMEILPYPTCGVCYSRRCVVNAHALNTRLAVDFSDLVLGNALL